MNVIRILQSAIGNAWNGQGDEKPRRRRRALVAFFLLLFLGVAVSACYNLITGRPITTLPGVSLVTKALAPRYVFSISGATTPEAVAVSPDGERIYVADSGGDRVVQVFTPKGERVMTLTPPGTMVSFRLPMSVAVAQDGRVFVSDRLRAAIDMYTPRGDYIGSYRPEAVWDEPWLPLGLNFDAQSRLLITDHREGKHRVLVFRANEDLDFSFGAEGSGADQFSFPYATAVDSRGQIYVSDSNNARISVFDKQGGLVNIITGAAAKETLGLPRGLAFDSLDRLHVVDGITHNVVVYETGGKPQFLFSFGELGTNGGEFRYPSGIAIDKFDRLYVADRDNNVVQVWSY